MLTGEDVKIQLERDIGGLPQKVKEKFPHISDYKTSRIPLSVDVGTVLKCQLAIASFDADGKCRNVTGLQLPGVLDDLFSYTGPLGSVFSEQAVSLYLWAPTAQAVYAHIYGDPFGNIRLASVKLEEENGVWKVDGPRSWEGGCYVYEVHVYHPSTLQIETCIVNDPYARGLSADGMRTLLVNLDHAALKPEGWDALADEKPDLASFSDVSIYELHIRDFSASDPNVNPKFRGGYLAFTQQDSAGMLHLKQLSRAGLTHVHLLPSFQFAGVADEKNQWKHVDEARLATLPPDSDEQQEEVVAIQEVDGYNWGYNPVLWGVPKGSYASEPNGPCRTLEYRQMVQALNRIGLRVVLDVVYNHVHGSGPLDYNSVLDKVVPGYYLRRNTDGFIENSTCINNTASEHFMYGSCRGICEVSAASNLKGLASIAADLYSSMPGLGIPLSNACVVCIEHASEIFCFCLCSVCKQVDGFRFDLMGHIMKRTMVKAKCALNYLSKDEHGVDGSKIYIYGEGWDFGEVAKNGRGINASQFNICGTGIGSFNDRIRDAVLGGSPFGPPLQQGFVTGLSLQQQGFCLIRMWLCGIDGGPQHDGKSCRLCDKRLWIQPNGHDQGSEAVMGEVLARLTDHIQVGLAANLRDFVLTNHEGDSVKGSEVLTHDGLPVAYAASPTETVNYASAHDNETLFDIVSLKTPVEISVNERCRINHLATSLVALSQGIPFFHAGDEILRSKSLDRDSYNSGDWFNRLDFSYESNNWGIGLPPKQKNEGNWHLIKPRLADPSFKPSKSNVLAALENFKDLLRIRYSSPLFRLRTANAIQERVRFHNTGPSWVPGVIAMSIEDGSEGMPGLSQLDPIYSTIVVIFNASPKEVAFASPALKTRKFELHPIQLTSADELVKNSSYEAASGRFIVPPRTTSVFVEAREI
ncbi:Pullulanase 1, chloroplastic [Asimina triloba]